jgi:hypothetical protein
MTLAHSGPCSQTAPCASCMQGAAHAFDQIQNVFESAAIAGFVAMQEAGEKFSTERAKSFWAAYGATKKAGLEKLAAENLAEEAAPVELAPIAVPAELQTAEVTAGEREEAPPAPPSKSKVRAKRATKSAKKEAKPAKNAKKTARAAASVVNGAAHPPPEEKKERPSRNVEAG